MQNGQMEILGEVLRGDSAPVIAEVELSQILAKLTQIVAEVVEEQAGRIDNRILELHYRWKMSFPDIALQIGLPEKTAREKWYRFLLLVSDEVSNRLLSDQKLASVLRPAAENPEAIQFLIPALLSSIQGELQPVPELAILKRAVETFGSHGDAVRWLLDDCPALNARPIDLAVNPSGFQSVEDVLGCIDNGMIF